MKSPKPGAAPGKPARPGEGAIPDERPQRKRGRKRSLAQARPAAISAEEFHERVAVAAYFRAQRRGFEAGHELEDWLAAEAEIRAQLGQRPS
jgi:hypothetical protein